MECKYCSKTIPNDSKYCQHCGKEQDAKPKRHRRHRPQSQGTITKLSGRRANPYWVRLPADYSSGVPVRESLGCFPTYAAAAEALSKALYVPKEEAQSKQKSLTMQDMYDRFITSNYYSQLSKRAQGSHRSAWKHLAQCKNVPVSQINKDTFQVPINAMREAQLKRETLAKVRNLASLLCKEAMGMGLINVNYGQLVQLPRTDTEPAKPFSSEQIRRLWEAADAGDRDAMTVLVLIYSGMRPGELLSTDIAQHLHMDGPYWYIQHGSKTAAGRNRIIPLPKILQPIIEQLVDGRTSGPLITAEQGGFWRLDNWRPRRFNPLMERLGLHGYTPYSARHCYADLQKRRHIAPEIMMEVMGHSDYSTTVEKYHTTTYEDISRICAAADGFERPGNPEKDINNRTHWKDSR